MTTKTTGTTVKDLLKVLVGLILMAIGIVVFAFWINPILGTITAFFVCFAWLFIAPPLAVQMVVALLLARRQRKG